ncbi:MAG: OsmC family protein [Bacteroidia bacterium]|nr:OsmC family protein [Bacteroidia bacterium]MCX7651308.1 OsmC family protein [Bacteroidia bacterium]MDW8417327.1 OsmC family protein [Bacteroidia bacterium]
MHVTLRWAKSGLHFIAYTEGGHRLEFDSPIEVGGTNQAARPMEGLLAAMLACFSADVVSILKKKRKLIRSHTVEAQAQRRIEYPQVFTHVRILLSIESPDATPADVERSIELSRTKYCSAMAMFEAAGCVIEIQYSLTP